MAITPAAAGSSPQPTAKEAVQHGVEFATRMRNMRAIGLGLGAFAVASGLVAQQAGPLAWALLVLCCFGWPHVAFALARLSADPVRAEYRNLEIDAVLGGAWVAAMGFNVLPSVLILSMLWMGDVAAGGWRLLLRASALQAGGALLVVTGVPGFELRPESGMLQVVASLPFLVVYPLAMAQLLRSLSRRVWRQNTLLESRSRTDSLTGLANRQHLDLALDAALERARREQRAATLMMIDVDGFKSVNDRDGHLAGDAMLVAVAQALRESVRGADLAGRYAGDEFTVLLPDADLACGMEVAERIRARVANLRLGDAGRRCTVSIGVAELDAGMRDVRDWLNVADQALYQSKRSGRNRVCTPEGVVGLRRADQRPPSAPSRAS
jgi:diguanylate cyclase